MSRNKVVVIKANKAVKNNVRKIIDLLGGLKLDTSKKVFIKPNICNPKNPYGMVVTDVGIIEAIIDILKDKTQKISIIESDNISGTAEKRALDIGLLQKLEDLNVEFINISREKCEPHRVGGIEIQLPTSALESNVFINLPKVKTEGHVLVSLSIKNLYGLIKEQRKNKYHRHLNKILPYLAETINHDLIIVDGNIAMEGNGPVIGSPKTLGLMIGGVNPVEVDAVCTRLMGFDPFEVEYLNQAHEMGLGDIDIDCIDIIGEDWKEVAQVFERPYSLKATLRSIRTVRKIYLSR